MNQLKPICWTGDISTGTIMLRWSPVSFKQDSATGGRGRNLA